MLTPAQIAIVTAPSTAKLFLRGAAGTGKTTVGVERLRALLADGVPADQILILTPQRTLQDPYLNLIHSPELAPGGEATPATIGGLARRLVDLFWPLAAEAAGFAQPEKPPVFLTLETAQYYMARLVRPHLEEGWFDSVVMDRNRLYSQILDNLNKAAMIGFPHLEIGERLSAAWAGEPAQRRVYADAQACANEFRQYCLEHNLLDFSLQLEIFTRILWNENAVRRYLTSAYRHLVYDNVEEDIPVAHDLLAEWLPEFDSALLIFDENAGYRRFLGADPESALELAALCDETVELDESFTLNLGLSFLSTALTEALLPEAGPEPASFKELSLANGLNPDELLGILSARFYPEMLEAVAGEVRRLIDEDQVPPGEIVILAPYLSDALRFSLMNRLESLGVPCRSHRPSRSLREEPASQCLLTLAALAHPGWGLSPVKFDVAYALIQTIEGLDLVRAQLLTEIVYRRRETSLSAFEAIQPEMQERITYRFGECYTQLKDWLETYRQSEPLPLDHFLRRLFGEVLSQPGFGFHRNFDAAKVAASLIESVQKFRWAMEAAQAEPLDIGQEYLKMLQEGVIAAQSLAAWNTPPEEAVLIAPAYTFLMSNRPVWAQFWLDAGSSGWHERLFQPLTQPYVLSRRWNPPGSPTSRLWTDADEVEANQAALARLLAGLLNRCRGRLYLGLTELGESGFEERGVLVRAFQQALQEK